jgi:hypothetical protein
MSLGRSVVDAALSLHKATRKRVQITLFDEGVNVSFKVRRKTKKRQQTGLSWTTAGAPRLNGKPISVNDMLLTEYDFPSQKDKAAFRRALTLAIKNQQVVKVGNAYLIDLSMDQLRSSDSADNSD